MYNSAIYICSASPNGEGPTAEAIDEETICEDANDQTDVVPQGYTVQLNLKLSSLRAACHDAVNWYVPLCNLTPNCFLNEGRAMRPLIRTTESDISCFSDLSSIDRNPHGHIPP